ncbi:hypothetical protein B6F84_01440 [Acidianus manzaensis]|uniref:Uncharacterized protein n=1 Tax=Acidianus manzaensis TaxID=282676 RepID=A0A1W6K3C7_9CREN|nr:hypothetical protein [Acidianus manzaensis]ARM77010.1 hypothetical protein B6F84_01440 [Acidianus manzaensis]
MTNLRRGIIIMTTFSFFYAMLEIGINWDPHGGALSVFSNNSIAQYFYRFLYISIFMYPAYLASKKLFSLKTIWFAIYGFLLEDIFYWILSLRIPYSWSWYYPVYYGTPIPDLLELTILIILFKKISWSN